MRMGLLTNSLTEVGVTDLAAIARWARGNGIAELEVGPSIPLDQAVFEQVMADGTEIPTLIYCRNFLSENAGEAALHRKALEERIAFAGKLGIEKIVCSTGVTQAAFSGMSFAPENSLDACVELFKGFLERAERHSVGLCWENCPMMGNIATSPDIWAQLFHRLDSDRIGLCYDPSHLVWQQIDPYRPLQEFRKKLFHVHGKDTEVDRERLGCFGVLQNAKWWRHRLPGLGEIDWQRFIDRLYEADYQGAISIEHEDPVWGGTEERVKRGILKARDHISRCFV